MFDFKKRSLLLERMDHETFPATEIACVLRDLEAINRWLGGVRATLQVFRRFARRWSIDEPIRVVDWGTGGADIPRALVRWARQSGFKLQVVGIDSNPAVLEAARRACRDFPEIELRLGDCLGAEAEPLSFDYAISSLCMHHLTDSQVVALLRRSDRLARRGIVMNDLMRDTRAWLWAFLLTRLANLHPVVRIDAPLSVRRAFRSAELLELAGNAGIPYLNLSRHFGYRWILAGEKR